MQPTIDLTDKLTDLGYLKEAWESKSKSHKTYYLSEGSFCGYMSLGHVVIDLTHPIWISVKTELTDVGASVEIDPAKAPIDPEKVYQIVLRYATWNDEDSGVTGHASFIRGERDTILQAWRDFLSLFAPPERDKIHEMVGYDS